MNTCSQILATKQSVIPVTSHGHWCISDHKKLDCMLKLKKLFRPTTKKSLKVCITGPWWGPLKWLQSWLSAAYCWDLLIRYIYIVLIIYQYTILIKYRWKHMKTKNADLGVDLCYQLATIHLANAMTKNTCCMKSQSHERLWTPLLKQKFGNGWLTSNCCSSCCKKYQLRFSIPIPIPGFSIPIPFSIPPISIPIPELELALELSCNSNSGIELTPTLGCGHSS